MHYMYELFEAEFLEKEQHKTAFLEVRIIWDNLAPLTWKQDQLFQRYYHSTKGPFQDQMKTDLYCLEAAIVELETFKFCRRRSCINVRKRRLRRNMLLMCLLPLTLTVRKCDCITWGIIGINAKNCFNPMRGFRTRCSFKRVDCYMYRVQSDFHRTDIPKNCFNLMRGFRTRCSFKRVNCYMYRVQSDFHRTDIPKLLTICM